MRLPFTVHSSDCHVIEPPDLWTKRIDKQWLGREPRIEHLEDTDIWMVDKDTRMAVVGIQDQAGLRFEDPTKITKKARMDDLARGAAGWIPDLYMEGMDEDGVWGAVIYPSNATQAFRCIQGPLLDALCKTYNDFMISEFCAAKPDRLKAVACINIDDLDVAIAEIQRVAKLGAGAIMLPVFPTHPKTYDQPEFEPLWACLADIGLPVVMHLGSNKKAFSHEPPLDLIVHATKDIHIQRSIATIVLGGVFARHPGLRLGAIEFGASWLPPLMANMDRLVEKHGKEMEFKFPDEELPSDHVRRNIFVSFQDDGAVVEMRDMVGLENLQWGNDYPHAEATYPLSHAYIHRQLEGVPDDEAAAIAGSNSAKMYGFSEPPDEWKTVIKTNGKSFEDLQQGASL